MHAQWLNQCTLVTLPAWIVYLVISIEVLSSIWRVKWRLGSWKSPCFNFHEQHPKLYTGKHFGCLRGKSSICFHVLAFSLRTLWVGVQMVTDSSCLRLINGQCIFLSPSNETEILHLCSLLIISCGGPLVDVCHRGHPWQRLKIYHRGGGRWGW